MQISLVPKRKRRLWLFLIAAIVVIALGYLFTRLHTSLPVIGQQFSGLTHNPPPSAPKEPNILSGEMVDPSVAKRRPLAIMVENHVDARPQAGLTKAAVVYEAIAEGGITRFMAVFSPADADKVGPVRSARQYYVEWAKGIDALYAHVGGSLDAKALIKSLGLADLDQFRYGTRAYHREPVAGVAIEHTMFTSTQLLYKVAQEAKFDLTAAIAPYQFKDEAIATERGAAQTITIPFSTGSYKVVWTYDPTTNTYLRAEAGTKHVDRVTGEQLTAKTIAVATVKRQPKPDEEGPGWTMTTTGSGKAQVFVDGKEVVGTWKRPGKTDMVRFYDESGKEIAFNRGQTWIEIVPPEIAVTVQ